MLNNTGVFSVIINHFDEKKKYELFVYGKKLSGQFSLYIILYRVSIRLKFGRSLQIFVDSKNHLYFYTIFCFCNLWARYLAL